MTEIDEELMAPLYVRLDGSEVYQKTRMSKASRAIFGAGGENVVAM